MTTLPEPISFAEKGRMLAALRALILDAHLAKDYAKRDRLCKQHDDLVLYELEPA